MTTKKTKTSKEQKERAELAAHISAVLRHPMTSIRLFDSIADELSDMLTFDWTTPEMVLRALDDDARLRQESEVTNQ